jgi:hypothetical protein
MVLALLTIYRLEAMDSPDAAASSASVEKLWTDRSASEKDKELYRETPVSSFIATRDAWEHLWRAWRPNERVPAVDFQKSIILAFAGPGYDNEIRVNDKDPHELKELPIDKTGDLKFLPSIIERGDRGYRYVILKVSRRGALSVNGHVLP